MNRKGAKLIVLSIILILIGILLLLLNQPKKSNESIYIDTVRQYIEGAKRIVNEQKQKISGIDTTYYIDINYIDTDGAKKSPYGDFVKAYVLITYDEKNHNYYWIGVDEKGYGIKNIIKEEDLNESSIESNIKVEDIFSDTVIGKRKNIKFINVDGSLSDGTATKKIPEDGGERIDIDKNCTDNPSISLKSDAKDIVTDGEIVNVDAIYKGFEKCDEKDMTYRWQFKGDITNDEWKYVDEYNLDIIVNMTKDRLSYVATKDSIKYLWRMIVNVDD